jgi:hypothetical protein
MFLRACRQRVADAKNPATAILMHVFAGERIHADDTTVPVLAKGKTRTGRLWTYVRDDRPFAGPDPPAAGFFYSRDRGGEHPEQHLANYAGLMQADAYAGFNRLYEANRKPGPILEAACWAHARRKFFDLAQINKRTWRTSSPMSRWPAARSWSGWKARSCRASSCCSGRFDLFFDAEDEMSGISVRRHISAG